MILRGNEFDEPVVAVAFLLRSQNGSEVQLALYPKWTRCWAVRIAELVVMVVEVWCLQLLPFSDSTPAL